MLKELKKESNRTLTENGAAAYRSTEDCCLDFFAVAGSLRGAEPRIIARTFSRAYAENPHTAMKILFYSRDIREGLGERRFYRIALRYAASKYPKSVIRNIEYIPEFGRFDDLIWLLATPCEKAFADYIKKQLREDIDNMNSNKPVSLLAKWMPSVNASNKYTKNRAKRICRLLGMSEKKYRKTLSSLRSHIDVLEKRLCKKDYTFDYKKQPSKALYNYRKAFFRNDEERYLQYIEEVKSGKVNMKTSSLYPYDIIRSCDTDMSEEQIEILDATWKSLTSYDNGQNAIAVVDGSGSMYWSSDKNIRPTDIAVSLGIYFAEHNSGKFANHFITFSESPRLIEIKGNNISAKADYCRSFDECSNTDIAKVFELILNTAVKNNLPQKEMPETIYIISDMEFDSQPNSEKSAFEYAKKQYENYGYRLPTVVFWNVSSRTEQVPVKKDDTGAVLVSGASPSIFSLALSNDIDPSKFMHDIIDSERYKMICA